MTTLGSRFRDALAFAAETHEGQVRKGPDGIPYIAHLLAVTSIVIENGGSEDQAIAALLHDVVEDHGGEPMAGEIERRFGATVAGIVRECSDSFAADPNEKEDWHRRKRAYLERLETASDGALRVSLADKLHNVHAISRDLRLGDNEVWERFSESSPVEQVRYYRSLVRRFRDRTNSTLVSDLDQAVERLRIAAGVSKTDADIEL